MVIATSDVESVRAPPDRNRTVNVAPAERFLSVLSGGLLMLYGVRRRAWTAVPFTLAGAVLLYRGISGHSRTYQRLGVSTARAEQPAIDVTGALTVRCAPDEVYRFWRDLENLPRIMHHLRSVTRVDDTRHRWVAQPPLRGAPLEWETEITTDRPNELLNWRSLPGSPIQMVGAVFLKPAPGDRGTEVHVMLEHRPASVAGAGLAKLMQPFSVQTLKESIRRSKQLLETGEIPTVEGQPSARAA